MAPIRNNNRQSITAGNGTNKVHLFSQRNGNKSIKFTMEEGSHEFGYTWSKYGKPTKENMQRYACTKCRTIYDASGKNGLAKLPLPAIIFDENNEEFVTSVPENAHYCEGPRNMNEIRGVEAKRTELARVRETRDKPRVAAINLTNQLTRRFGNRPEEVRQEIAAAAMTTKGAFAKAASRASNTDVPKISKISDLNDEKHKPSMLTLGGEVRYLSGVDGAEEEKHVLWWNERNVILGSPYYTDKFIEPDELFCDGTFLYAPQLPEVPQRNIQLYRIFGLIHETVIVPCFTIIMQKKTEDEYKIVFEAIADIVGRWRLAARIAHFDGETAAVNAFKSIRKFRRIKCKMCSFHVRQCLHRHGATLGLTRDYGEEKNQFIKHFTTSIGGLQHAPTGILDEAVTALNDFLNGQHAIDQAVIEKLQYLLNEYFVPTWLEHSLGIEFVSAADVTTNCTNNYAETFHGNQKLFYKQPHAKLGQFLFDDRRLQNCLETEIKLMESGDHDIPEKNDDGDRKRASTRARMMNQLAVANVNRGEIILKYVHRLGKYAGGCWSNVGRVGGKQTVSIGYGCDALGIVAHETLHALGLWHEQSRYDRDDYVNVDFGFIFPGTQSNFAKRNKQNSDNLGQRYDLGSVMHYGAKAFSTDYSRDTIVTKDTNYQYTIGQRIAVSFKDARMINTRYCSDICKKELECKNGGYTDPNNCKQCKCPKGLGGTYCDQVAYSPNGICNGRDLKASKDWSQFESPALDEGLNCFWRVLAPEGEAVEIEITYSSFPCKDACNSFVEVKYLADKTTTGARLCCNIPEKTIISEDNFILLWLRTDPELIHGYLGFKMRYRTVSSSATPSPVPTTTTTTTVKTTTTGRGDPEWSDWGVWGTCSVKCGGCGQRTRVRACYGGNGICEGKDIENEYCGQESCEKPKKKTTRCTGRLVLPCDLMDELDFGTTHSADPFQKPTIELLQTHKNAKTLKRVRREASQRFRRFVDGNKQMADGNFCEKRFTYNCPTSLLTINIDRKINKDVSIEQCCPGFYKNQGRCVDGRRRV